MRLSDGTNKDWCKPKFGVQPYKRVRVRLELTTFGLNARRANQLRHLTRENHTKRNTLVKATFHCHKQDTTRDVSRCR
jgi:hypothetical protein